ncbi:hypothetical protein HZH68_016256 [Vespula germanica]|uniref:Uncharacterized protein n=1 Tax=Vespula germanica TaxID=30212 RepID=A0A834J1C6_VESGE|nr:hypothetical protein HZH68_016256 [Vespula germanica]
MGEIGNDKENLRAINNDSKKEDLRIDVEDEEEEKGDAGDAVDDDYEGTFEKFIDLFHLYVTLSSSH